MKTLVTIIQMALQVVGFCGLIMTFPICMGGIIGGIFDPKLSILPSFYLAIKSLIYFGGVILASRLLMLLPKSIRPEE